MDAYKIIQGFLDMAGLTLSEELSQELKLYRIKRDNTNLQAIVKCQEETLNPFQENLPELYCLTTGRATSADVQNDLTGVVDKGNGWYKEFVTECQADPKRFEKPIKGQKVKNFTGEDKKIKEIRCTRNVFGRLLFLAATNKLDLANVLSSQKCHFPFVT